MYTKALKHVLGKNIIITGPITWFGDRGAIHVACFGHSQAKPIPLQVYGWF